jgi:hypothetical protein
MACYAVARRVEVHEACMINESVAIVRHCMPMEATLVKFSSGNVSGSRRGLKGTEDLGGGLAARDSSAARCRPPEGSQTTLSCGEQGGTLSLHAVWLETRIGI